MDSVTGGHPLGFSPDGPLQRISAQFVKLGIRIGVVEGD